MFSKTPALSVLEYIHHFHFCGHKRQGSLGTAGTCVCRVCECPQAPLGLPRQQFWIPVSWDLPKPTWPHMSGTQQLLPTPSLSWQLLPLVRQGWHHRIHSTQRVSSRETAHPAVQLWLRLAPFNRQVLSKSNKTFHFISRTPRVAYFCFAHPTCLSHV